MSSAFEREIEEQANALTTCSICTDVFTTPKVLPCQHTFCLVCLQKHHDAANSQRLVPVSSFACPTCRKVCYVPRHSLGQLPTDFKVDQILDLVKIISRSKLSTKTAVVKSQESLADCVVCRSMRDVVSPAEVFCVQCARSFCKSCANHHSRTPVFREHSVIPTVAAAASTTWKCALHDHEVQYFCDQCVVPACTICVLSIHEKHSISDHKTVAGRLQEQLTKSFSELSQKKEDLQLQLSALVHLRQEHGRNLQESERSVLGASREAYRKIRELEEQMLADFRSCNREKMEKIDSSEKELSERMESLASLCQSLSDVLTYTNLKDFFDSYSQLAIKVQKEMGEEGPDVGTALRDVSTFVPRIQVKLGEMEKSVLTIEELIAAPPTAAPPVESRTPNSEEKKKKTATGSKQSIQKKNSEAGSRTSPVPEQTRGRRTDFLNTLERRLNQQRQQNPNRANVTSNTDNLNSTTNNNNIISSRGLDSNNNISVTGGKTSQTNQSTSPCSTEDSRTAIDVVENIRRTDTGGELDTGGLSYGCGSPTNPSGTRLWISEDFSACRDCCFTSGGQVVATDWSMDSNRIKLFASSSGQFLDAVDSCLVVQPWGVFCNNSVASILLTDHGGSPSLKTMRVGSTRDIRVYRCQMDRPSGVAVTRSGEIVLSDTGSKRHKIGIFSNLNSRMTKIREFGSHGDGEGEVLRANYVTVDHNDRVIVSDCDSHTVKVFSVNGQQLLKFSSSRSDGSEMSPQGLAVDDANNIFVADQATQGIVKYSPHGQLIETVVQTMGTPWGISVCWDKGLLAAATSRGLEVFRL